MGLLGVLFIGLKLTGFIDWSWFWVLAPFWGSLAFFAAILVGCFIFYVVTEPVADFVGPYWETLMDKIKA